MFVLYIWLCIYGIYGWPAVANTTRNVRLATCPERWLKISLGVRNRAVGTIQAGIPQRDVPWRLGHPFVPSTLYAKIQSCWKRC